jgi:DNA-binding beta-propeller fold protein YncE
MSYTEYLRRKEAAAPKVIDTTLRLDASSYTQRLKFAASRVLNEVNLRTVEQTDQIPTVSTLAGIGTSGTANGAGLTVAQFSSPAGICIDPAGLNLYVTDNTGNRIRRIVIATGVVSTVAGTTSGFADGAGLTVAQFSSPFGICIDPAGLNLYVADIGNNRIRKVEIATGVVSTFAGIGTSGSADGAGLTVAQFSSPIGICIDSAGLNLYVTEQINNRIRRIVIATGVVSTVAGTTSGFADGEPLTVAQFSSPRFSIIDPAGLNLYVADIGNNRIRRLTPLSAFTLFRPIISINKTKSGGRIPDASTYTQYAGGQAVGKEVQAGMPPSRLLLNSTSEGSLTGCRIVPEPIPYNPAVGGVYSANMVRRDASQFTRDETACRELTGEPHNRNELGPSLFVDNTIVGVKNYNLPQNNSKTYTATKCTQCGNNGAELAKTCSFCIGANHLHPVEKPTNVRWGPRPKKSAQPIIVNQSPSDFHKVGAAMRKIPYVEKHHANPQIGHIIYPKTPYRIPRGTAAHLKINDPQRYPGTM